MRRLTVLCDLDIAMIQTEVAEDIMELPTADACLQTIWVRVVGRTISHICVEVGASPESDRVFRDEPSRLRIVVPRSRKLQVGFRVEISSCVAERIGERASRSGHISERVVRVALRQCSGRVAQ